MRITRFRLRTKVAIVLITCAGFFFAVNFLLLEQESSYEEQSEQRYVNKNGFATKQGSRVPKEANTGNYGAKKWQRKLVTAKPKARTKPPLNVFDEFEKDVQDKLSHIPDIHLQMKFGVRELVEEYSRDLSNKTVLNQSPWTLAASWVNNISGEVFPSSAPKLGSVLTSMVTLPIMRASFAEGGSQLKINLILQGGQKVLYKPKKYGRDEIIYGVPYGGDDRHNGEIAAFHLARLLDMRWIPLAVGRKISLSEELVPFADKELLDTFLTKDGNTCFYGKCTYCKPSYAACADGNVMEGAVILWLPYPLKSHAHPWRRTYRKGKLAPWQQNINYCDSVKAHALYASGPRLLSLIDVAIFDFLIGNADRHHYVTFDNKDSNTVLLMDNGKSFGNPIIDAIDILAPLLQCCNVRRKTWERLQLFTGQALSQTLKELLSRDKLSPVLADVHFWSLDRRLLKVLAAIELCVDRNGKHFVLVDDNTSITNSTQPL